MAGFEDPAFYGDVWSDSYDEEQIAPDPAAAVDYLAELAGGGAVLELGVGTGRVAIPLATRGIAVEGLDASADIAARMRAKPGGETVPVTIGDMAEVPVMGPFQLVYLVFNSLFCLLSHDQQARCFQNVADVLDPGGLFVIECFVPDPARHTSPQQRVTTQVVTHGKDGVRLLPVVLRYEWPSELDLMAARAGLQLRERYSDWHRQPFSSDSTQHISVYQRAASP
ncbi:MAG: class I SAM-dependent methyltransferase [Actinomycetota bacterium]